MNEQTPIKGRIAWEIRGEDGQVKDSGEIPNLVTAVGNQYYADRAAGIGSIAAVTGMQLGTGTTAVAATGAGAAIVTLVASSLVAISPTTPASGAGTGNARRLTYTASWAAGTATNSALAEVALVNQSTGTQTAATAANTIARALLSPTINKGASDTLTITWTHDIGS